MLEEAILSAELEATDRNLEKITFGLDCVDFIVSAAETGVEIAKDAAEIARMTQIASEVAKDAQAVQGAVEIGDTMLALGTLNVLLQYVSFWLNLAGAHAGAQAEIAKDHAMRGASYGVVLGANGAGPSYVKENFWLWAKPMLAVYPEFAQKAQNIQNASLVVAYHIGKKLSDQAIGRLFTDLHARMDAADFDYYSGSFKEWSPQKRRDYYIGIAALFRRDHLK